jgi:2-polyprenyl-3-methyl-5-hydroxy-6-metoxy-1,4-benzoquinol methylase
MEREAIQSSNYAKAAHHKNMQNILVALKAKLPEQSYSKTPEQISDEDYKVSPTSGDKVAEVSNKSFPEWPTLYDVSEEQIAKLPWYSRELDPDLRQELENRNIKTGKFLDLGTGPATQALQLSKLGFDVTASDISVSAIARCKTLSKNIKFVTDDILNSKLENSQFDYIFDRGCFHVLEPSDRPPYVTKVNSLLSADGILFLKTFSTKEPSTYGPHHFSAEIIKELFEENFEILSSKETVFQGTLPRLPKALFSVMRKRTPQSFVRPLG